MLGIKKVDTTHLSHGEFWTDCLICSVGSLIDFAEQMVGILSFGRLTTDWCMYWFNFTLRKKDK